MLPFFKMVLAFHRWVWRCCVVLVARFYWVRLSFSLDWTEFYGPFPYFTALYFINDAIVSDNRALLDNGGAMVERCRRHGASSVFIYQFQSASLHFGGRGREKKSKTRHHPVVISLFVPSLFFGGGDQFSIFSSPWFFFIEWVLIFFADSYSIWQGYVNVTRTHTQKKEIIRKSWKYRKRFIVNSKLTKFSLLFQFGVACTTGKNGFFFFSGCALLFRRCYLYLFFFYFVVGWETEGGGWVVG